MRVPGGSICKEKTYRAARSALCPLERSNRGREGTVANRRLYQGFRARPTAFPRPNRSDAADATRPSFAERERLPKSL